MTTTYTAIITPSTDDADGSATSGTPAAGGERPPITVTGLPSGDYTFQVVASNADGLGTPSTSSASVTVARSATGAHALTRSGSYLRVGGVTRRFSGLNALQLGLDTDNGGPSGQFIPAHSSIAAALGGLAAMGCTMVRSHTLGMQAASATQFMTGSNGALGTYSGANLDAADYAIHCAQREDIYLMAPLVDDYNYFTNGKWSFVHLAYQDDPSGITDVNGDNGNEDQFYATTRGGLRIRALWFDFITNLLNHVNPYTGLAWKDDPTLALIETGNEIDSATAEWTQATCAHIKAIAPDKLTVDGSGASWDGGVTTQAGYGLPAVDILSQHYYPKADQGETFETISSRIRSDAAAAVAAGQAFIIGEYPWTFPGYTDFWRQVEELAECSFDAAWVYINNDASGNPEGHGGAFGGSDVAIHGPYSGSMEARYGPALTSHICSITGRTRGPGY